MQNFYNVRRSWALCLVLPKCPPGLQPGRYYQPGSSINFDVPFLLKVLPFLLRRAPQTPWAWGVRTSRQTGRRERALPYKPVSEEDSVLLTGALWQETAWTEMSFSITVTLTGILRGDSAREKS